MKILFRWVGAVAIVSLPILAPMPADTLGPFGVWLFVAVLLVAVVGAAFLYEWCQEMVQDRRLMPLFRRIIETAAIPAIVIGAVALVYGWSGCGRFCPEESRREMAFGAGALVFGIAALARSKGQHT